MSAHPGDLLSAYLDGELVAHERAEVEAHLAGRADCRDELDGERAVRDLLRSLPAVDVPFGFYERLLRDGLPGEVGTGVPQAPVAAKHRRRFGWANVVATAAAWLLFIGIAGNDSSSPAPVAAADMIQLSAAPAALTTTVPPAEATRTASGYGVPSSLEGGYRLVGVRDDGQRHEAIYADGQRVLRVYVVPGHLEWERLPEPRSVTVNGVPAWEVRTERADVVLVQRPDAVVVIVGPPSDADPAMAADLDPAVPEDDDSFGDRITGAARDLLETFGFR